MANRHATGTPASHARHDSPRTVPEGGTATPIPGAGPGARPPLRPPPVLRAPLRLLRLRHRHRPRRRARRLRRRAARASSSSSAACSRTRSRPSSSAAARRPSPSPRRSRACSPALPDAAETTVEANPETVTPELAALLREHGVDRVSLGAQSFQPHLLETLERRASPDDVRGAVRTLRDAGFDNVSLDLIYGIPGQSAADLERDLAEAIALEPEHLSCYELEAKPGTRFTHAHGDELERQAEAMEDYFERVVETPHRRRLPLVRDGELLPHRTTAAICAPATTSATGSVTTTSGSASAPSRPWAAAAGGTRRACRATSPRSAAASGRSASSSSSSRRRAARERVMLGLRLDQPLRARRTRTRQSTATRSRGCSGTACRGGRRGTLELTRRGRFLGGGVTAELLVES